VYTHYGSKQQCRSFPSDRIPEAIQYKKDKEFAHLNRGNPEYRKRTQAEELNTTTVGYLIEEFVESCIPQRIEGKVNDEYGTYCRSFLLHKDFPSEITLAEIDKHYFTDFFEKRLAEGVKPNTIRWYKTLLSKAFDKAIKDNWWGICRLMPANPLDGIKMTLPKGGKQRYMLPDEEQKLWSNMDTCTGSVRYYLPLAIYIAIDTGMRRKEIINLRWSDIDFEKRRINIREHKTSKRLLDKGLDPERFIVMPVETMMYLVRLHHILTFKGAINGATVPDEFKPMVNREAHIFLTNDDSTWRPWAGKSLSEAFENLCFRSGIDKEDRKKQTLTFHSLRKNATRAFMPVLGVELTVVMKDGTLAKGYGPYIGGSIPDATFDQIEEKLDKHLLKVHLLDQMGRKVKDLDDEFVVEGVTLGRLIRMCNGNRKFTAKEMLEKGDIPIPYIASKWQLGPNRRVIQDSAIVFRCDRNEEGNIIAYDPVGYLNLKSGMTVQTNLQ